MTNDTSLPELRRRGRVARRRLLRAFRDAVHQDLQEQAASPVKVVQVGACDGTMGDPIADAIERWGWHGLLIEPVPHFFAKLYEKYKDNKKIKLVNCAISERVGDVTIHVLNPAAEARYPKWARGLASFDRRHIQGTIPEHDVTAVRVPMRPLAAVVEEARFGDADVLVVDVEGAEISVFSSIDFTRFRPKVVDVEIRHLAAATKRELFEQLRRGGYEIVDLGIDAVALRKDAMLASTARLVDVVRHAGVDAVHLGVASPAEDQGVAVVGFVRFSFVAHLNAREWKTRFADEDEQIRHLFDDARMEARFELFERFCLPSLRRQRDPDFRVFVVASTLMPERYRARLAALVADDPRIAVVFRERARVNDICRELVRADPVGRAERLCQFRLDDDDALNADFVTCLKRDARKLRDLGARFVVSYPHGIVQTRTTNGWRYNRATLLLNAQGFALISRGTHDQTPFCTGHVRAYRVLPVASIPQQSMYLYTFHGGNDSAGRITLFEEIEPAAMATLAAEQFPFLEIAGSTG